MNQCIDKVETRSSLPNTACIIFVSCAKLEVSDTRFWHDFDKIILAIISQMRLKNLSSLSFGLLLRDKNGIEIDNELASSFLKTFVLTYNSLKKVYLDLTETDKKYTRICLNTINKLV